MKRFMFVLGFLVSAVPLFAQTAGWKLDRAHSGMSFSIKHMVISEVTGNFKDYDIAVTSSKDDFSDLAVTATIKVASINTENERRDKHLKSDDFFNAEKFPEIKFVSTSVEKAGEKNFKINGDLTIRDVTKKVTFDAVYNGSLKTQRGTLAAWKATTAINRFDYNLKWSRAIEIGGLVVGETVNITLNIELNK